MTYPLVSQYGIEWLSSNVGHLKLFKPAYEGDKLTIKTDAPAAGQHLATVHCYNALEVELAKLETGIAPALPEAGAWANMKPAAPAAERTPISWDAVVVDKPLRELAWTPTLQQQEQWCHAVSDLLPVYRASDSPVHPGLILQAANHVLSGHFVLKPWIHMESRVVTRSALRVGKPVQVRAVPTEKWEKNGHQFLKLYVCMLSGGRVAVEVQHSAIFSVRPVAKSA
jgi:menaquinone-dependent protoporphyrinogen IX oxidase